MAAGTVTTTEERLTWPHKITFAWTSGTDAEEGTASGTTTYQYSGNILRVVTVPGTGGDAPTDDYDITITDASSIDVANSQLLNRDDTNTEWVVASLGAVANDKLTINVSAAGAANTGTCIVYVGAVPALDDDTDIENALFGATGIAAFPNAADPANNVSLAEVIRAIWAGLWGTAAGENGITTYPAAAAAANNVSIAEVVRYIQASQIGTITNSGGTATLGAILGDIANSTIVAKFLLLNDHIGPSYNNTRYIAVTADMTSATWNTSAGGGTHEVFTVTGAVRMRIWVTCTGNLASAGDGATLTFGIAGAADAFIAATNEDALDDGDLWYDASPTVTYDTFGNAVMDYVINNGTDVGYAIVGEDLTAGTLVFHCVWEPLSATGAVAAGAGGAL